MPVTKSAIKKLRQDKKRTAANSKIKSGLRSTVKSAKKTHKTSLNEAYSTIDRAAKRGIIHPNKAARLKSQVSKVAPKKAAASTPKKAAPKKKAAPAKPKKK